jgi:ribosomal-protein-alanine N-acetyltransferase
LLLAYALVIEAKDSETRIGRISLRRKENARWNLGFWTHPEFQGQGYMTEAAAAVLTLIFSELGGEVVEAACATWNTSSRRVLEKVGMKFARHEPEGFQKAGEWVAEDIYEIRRIEWESLRVGSN